MRRTLSPALATLVGLSVVGSLATVPAQAADAVSCTASKSALAARLKKDIAAALAGRTSTISVTVVEPAKGVRCEVAAARRFDSASVFKVTLLGTLLRELKVKNRVLTKEENTRATAMITKSDNDSTTALWRQLGKARVQAFLKLAGTTDSSLDPSGAWGITQISARDQIKVLNLLTKANSVLRDADRAYALKLMSTVASGQRWGAPAGAPSGVKVQVKNGWLSRATHGWRVHSDGVFTGGGRDYKIVVLTQDNATLTYGIDSIERVAKVVHRDLAAG